MLQSTKAKLVDLLSGWLEEAKNQEGDEVGAYANCAHDLNAIICEFEQVEPLSTLLKLIKEEKIELYYTTSDDGIHVGVDGEEVFVGWFGFGG